ncbi:MAG TPA: trehalase family glycosidase, partial [Chitinophagaceae bacterium]|nr:trehalase family glycosidase [Chitinophagaceae bacterium]
WSLDHHIPYPDSIRDLLLLSERPDRFFLGRKKIPVGSFHPGLGFSRGQLESRKDTGRFSLLGFFRQLSIGPGSFRILRLVRAVAAAPARPDPAKESALLRQPLEPFLAADRRMMDSIPDPHLKDPAQRALYWSACNMMRQEFYPPEGRCRENYYVFSREPMWGWGHGGQVFHESLSMLEYVRIDPAGAEGSQLNFADRQQPDGYINYRTGPYLDETIPANGSLTSSAPWYNWENWEIYRQTHDRSFLKRMYGSGERFFRWFVTHRDSDRDGLCEWGGDPVLESVRDGEVAVWDQVGPPSAFNSPDLNCMLVREARSLEQMALSLGRRQEAAAWKQDYERRIVLINRYCWDSVRGFYYNVTLGDHRFTYRKENDLKRDEIIGFLPLWAGVASPRQARRLVEKLTDTAAFWRPFGIPSLSASDSDYNPEGYWNGPVWVQWNYLIERGLLDYGYRGLAKEIASRVSANMIAVLGRTHELWELYSPDRNWGGIHRTYIWAGLINLMMTDAEGGRPAVN